MFKQTSEFKLKGAVVFLVSVACVFLAIGQSTLQIHASDFTDYSAPFESSILSALSAPIAIILLPALAVSALYFLLNFLSVRLSRFYLSAIISLAFVLFACRIYYIQTENYFLSVPGVAVGFVVAMALALLTFKYLTKFLYIYSFIALFLSLYFSVDYYRYLERQKSYSLLYDTNTLDNLKGPIYLFVFDELSGYLIQNEQGEIDGELFPELKEFSQTATWYPNASTPHTSTVTTLSAVVSGQDIFDVCSENGTLSVNEISQNVYKKKCGTNNFLVFPGVAHKVHVSGSKFGRTQIIHAKKAYAEKQKAMAKLDPSKIDQLMLEEDDSSYQLSPYLTALIETYTQGSLSPSWVSAIANWRMLFKTKERVPENAEIKSDKAETSKTEAETEKIAPSKEEIFANLKKEVISKYIKGGVPERPLDTPSFLQCKGYIKGMLSSFDHFVENFDPETRLINTIIADFTHVPFCADPDGIIEVVYPKVRATNPAGETVYLEDALAIYNRAESQCTFDEVPHNVRRSRVNQSKLAIQQFQRALDKIKEIGVWDESTIIFMSDHGRGFVGPAAGRRGQVFWSEQQKNDNRLMNAAIPLLIKYPKQTQGSVDNKLVRPKDIGATLIDIMGISPAWEVQGQSLLKEGWKEPELPLMFAQSIFFPDGKAVGAADITSPVNYFKDFKARLNRIDLIESDWIGKAVSEIPLSQTKGGQLEYLKIEKAMPIDGEMENVLTLGGNSYVQPLDQKPERTYIAVNGKIVKAITPCLRFKGKNHKWGGTSMGWVATIPHSSIKSRNLSIRAFSPVDKTETSFYELTKPIKITLSNEQYEKVTKERL